MVDAAPTPPAAPPAVPPTPPLATPPAPAAGDWTVGFSDDHKSYIQNKGFKTPAEVLESYRNFEKLQGVPQDRLLKLPENMDTPEGRAIWERLGRPKDSKDYSIDLPKENPDPKLADWLRTVADEGNFTQRQVETLVKKWNERQGATHKAFTDESTAASVVQEQKLKTDWGAAFDQNINIAKSAVQTMKWDQKTVDALQSSIGYDGVMKLLHQLGTATGEHNFVNGDPANKNMMSPEGATKAINDMIGDEGFRKRLSAGDADAKRQWDNAHKMAYPGTMSL